MYEKSLNYDINARRIRSNEEYSDENEGVSNDCNSFFRPFKIEKWGGIYIWAILSFYHYFI